MSRSLRERDDMRVPEENIKFVKRIRHEIQAANRLGGGVRQEDLAGVRDEMHDHAQEQAEHNDLVVTFSNRTNV